MKYRYIKVNSDYAYGKNEIIKQDLVDIVKGHYDALIDCQEGKTFDKDKNAWVDISGE